MMLADVPFVKQTSENTGYKQLIKFQWQLCIQLRNKISPLHDTTSLYIIYMYGKAINTMQRYHSDTESGTEELAHLEMISAIVYQLTKNLTPEEIKASGFDKYFVDHGTAIYPASAAGVPFTASYFQSKADPFADLTEDMAAEQKARATYDNILRLADDPDVKDPIRYLREREIVHFQRFGEAMRLTQDQLSAKNFYACNPSFDKGCGKRGCQR